MEYFKKYIKVNLPVAIFVCLYKADMHEVKKKGGMCAKEDCLYTVSTAGGSLAQISAQHSLK